ncbi:unnamed protein product [Cutaneotrichosporon oleaginosum]
MHLSEAPKASFMALHGFMASWLSMADAHSSSSGHERHNRVTAKGRLSIRLARIPTPSSSPSRLPPSAPPPRSPRSRGCGTRQAARHATPFSPA